MAIRENEYGELYLRVDAAVQRLYVDPTQSRTIALRKLPAKRRKC